MVACRHGTAVVIPMTYGRDVDWARNIVRSITLSVRRGAYFSAMLNDLAADPTKISRTGCEAAWRIASATVSGA